MCSNTSGIIFDVQRLSVQDGPGIRTTIFFKGCPLKCLWCHNPESLTSKLQLIFRNHKCAHCGSCVPVCPAQVHYMNEGRHFVDNSKCDGCGNCIRVCCYDALELLGKQMTVDEAVKTVMIDRPYFKNGGGVTFSGGEPMAQSSFATELAKQLQELSISVVLETCGFAPPGQYRNIAPYIDVFLFDYKATGAELHKELTGVEPDTILQNLQMLNDMNKEIILRCPMVHKVNDSRDHLKAIADIYHRLDCVTQIDILPYNKIGETKRIQLGETPSLSNVETPDIDMRRDWIDSLQGYGCDAKIV